MHQEQVYRSTRWFTGIYEDTLEYVEKEYYSKSLGADRILSHYFNEFKNQVVFYLKPKDIDEVVMAILEDSEAAIGDSITTLEAEMQAVANNDYHVENKAYRRAYLMARSGPATLLLHFSKACLGFLKRYKKKDFAEDEWVTYDLQYRELDLPPHQYIPKPQAGAARQAGSKAPTFKWQVTDDQAKELYDSLTKQGVIEGSEEAFMGVIGLADFAGPVVWVSGVAVELLYFLGTLLPETGEESGHALLAKNTRKWESVKGCFVKPDGAPFTENLKQIYQNRARDISPDRKKRIDRIVAAVV